MEEKEVRREENWPSVRGIRTRRGEGDDQRERKRWRKSGEREREVKVRWEKGESSSEERGSQSGGRGVSPREAAVKSELAAV